MGQGTSDGSMAQLERTDVHTVVGGTERLPQTLSEVIEPEGAAETDSSRDPPACVAWVFAEGADPRQATLDELPEIAADDERFVWVDLDHYDAPDLEGIARQLDLPEGAVRIALSGWQRPRVSVFRDRFFVAATVPHGDPASERLLASELDLFVGRNSLVSAHKRPLPFTERALARSVQNPALLKLDSAFLLSILIDELLAYYEELTEGLQDDVEAMEERALADPSETFLEDLLRLKRFVFAVHRLASQHRPVLEAFLRPDFPLVGGDVVEPYFRDLEVRLERLLDTLDTAKEAINGAFDLYDSQVSRRTNDVMKLLTIVSVTLLPSMVLLGFFGTNFELPQFTTTAAFIVMVALIVLTISGALLLFTRWGWLGRPKEVPAESIESPRSHGKR